MTATLSLQHEEWHLIHGKYQTCPLDCAAGEHVGEFFEADAEALTASGERGVRCGNCKQNHTSIAAVRFCFEVKYDRETFARREAAAVKAIREGGECEHGLSQALCAGPGHYPMD